MADVGIDFGTTNSSVIWISRTEQVLSLLSSPKPNAITVPHVPTLLYIRKAPLGKTNIVCGLDIGEDEKFSPDGSLVTNLKTKLRNATDIEPIFGIDKWDLFSHFLKYLVNNANTSPYILAERERVENVVMSVPYHSDAVYVEKIKSVAEKTEFTDSQGQRYHINVTHIQEEPVAIALTRFTRPKSAPKVLVYDMGGGTTDYAVVKRNNDGAEVIKHDGINRAGNYIDELIAGYLLDRNDCPREQFFSKSNRLLSYSMQQVQRGKEDLESGSESVSITLRINYIELEEELTHAEYQKIISPFIHETVERALALIDDSVTAAVLAGGGSNCAMIYQLFVEEGTLRLNSSSDDKTIATAHGNAEWFHFSTIDILNHSYAIKFWDEKKEKNFILNAIYKDERIPIENRRMDSLTIGETDRVVFKFFVGNDTKEKNERIYDYQEYKWLTGKDFVFKFDTTVPADTEIRTSISVDENGVISLLFESDYAQPQTYTLLDGLKENTPEPKRRNMLWRLLRKLAPKK